MAAFDTPFWNSFFDIVARSVQMGASDIHIEPKTTGLVIRVRKDGVLRPLMQVHELKIAERLLHQCKKYCGFDMATLNKAQDSRLRVHELKIDLRCNLVPTITGEKMVLRILPQETNFSLEKMNLRSEVLTDIREVLQKWQGLILVTGPTGSGKTTFLYSCLAEINAEDNNIHTLEDPIEYQIPHISQSSVGAHMNFAQGIAALMRQDPDVILLGEMRDKESAEAAIHAAQTGHLVLSTIHAKSCEETLARLEGLGVKLQIAEQVLLFVSSQRLVPKKCSCDGNPGCQHCEGTGIASRELVFEYWKKQGAEGVLPWKKSQTLGQQAQALLQRGVIRAEDALGLE